MPAIARFKGRFLRKLVLGAGWLAFALVLLCCACEWSGLLADVLRKELRGRAGGLPLELEGARLAWFDTRVDLYGLRVGEGEGSVQIDKAEVHWGFDLRSGLQVRGLVLRGGRARITPDFVRALESRVGGRPASPSGFELPPLVVRDLKLEVQSERWKGLARLGSVDLRAQEKGGGIEAEGALHLNVGEVYLHGALSADQQLALETLATGLPVSQAYLPEAAHDFQPRGSLALEGHVGADLRPEGRASGTLRLSLSDASLYVAHGTQFVDHLSLRVRRPRRDRGRRHGARSGRVGVRAADERDLAAAQVRGLGLPRPVARGQLACARLRAPARAAARRQHRRAHRGRSRGARQARVALEGVHAARRGRAVGRLRAARAAAGRAGRAGRPARVRRGAHGRQGRPHLPGLAAARGQARRGLPAALRGLARRGGLRSRSESQAREPARPGGLERQLCLRADPGAGAGALARLGRSAADAGLRRERVRPALPGREAAAQRGLRGGARGSGPRGARREHLEALPAAGRDGRHRLAPGAQGGHAVRRL